jgi:2-oxoglutarate dehydrogenase E2 component (dihydrolipoamide succinyltransferase)
MWLARNVTVANARYTGQIDVAVNAPEAGTIKEFLANEEDTVTVGQDLVRLETGPPPEGGDKPAAKEAKETPKDEVKKEESVPEKKPEQESKPAPKQESKPAPSPNESKPSKPEPKQPAKSSDAAPATPGLGNREERRVSDIPDDLCALARHPPTAETR